MDLTTLTKMMGNFSGGLVSEFYLKQLIPLLEDYKGGYEYALDGDEVEPFIEHIRNHINLLEGNITLEEFRQREEPDV